MPGKHITDQQAKLYMNHRRTHTREAAAAKAGFSTISRRLPVEQSPLRQAEPNVRSADAETQSSQRYHAIMSSTSAALVIAAAIRSAIMAAAAFTGSAAKCAYRAVVCG